MHKYEMISMVQPSILKTPTSLDGKSKKKKKKAPSQPSTPQNKKQVKVTMLSQTDFFANKKNSSAQNETFFDSEEN